LRRRVVDPDQLAARIQWDRAGGEDHRGAPSDRHVGVAGWWGQLRHVPTFHAHLSNGSKRAPNEGPPQQGPFGP
jgi:hypothetical protein